MGGSVKGLKLKLGGSRRVQVAAQENSVAEQTFAGGRHPRMLADGPSWEAQWNHIACLDVAQPTWVWHRQP